MSPGRQVFRKWNLLGRPPLEVVPARERFPVAANMFSARADRQDDAPLSSGIHELPSRCRTKAQEVTFFQFVGLPFDEHRQDPRQDEVHLLLLAMAMYPSALPGLER